MGQENWGLFKMPSDQASDSLRCEPCQLLTCTYVTGVEELLRLALWLDRSLRFGKAEDLSEIAAKIHTHSQEVTHSWQNYLSHREQNHTKLN